MCLLLQQPKGRTLSRKFLSDAFTRNPHGFGIMSAHNGALSLYREVGTVETMLTAYARYGAGKECFIHFRMATHGEKNKQNAHPFRLAGSDAALMHNGILDCGSAHSGMSDTYHYARYVIAPAVAGDARTVFADSAWRETHSELIGTSNKIAILHADGRHVILNRDSGVEWEGLWLSNTYAWNCPDSLKPKARYAPSRYYGAEWNVEPAHYIGTPSGIVTRATTIDRATVTTCDTPSGMFDAMRDAWETRGIDGVLAFIRDYPITARDILADYATLSPKDADAWIRSEPNTAAEWMGEYADILAEESAR